MAIRLDRSEDELTEMSEINVTPFIDVMLVLLIVFMVAAPLATVDVPIDLPASNAQQRTLMRTKQCLTLDDVEKMLAACEAEAAKNK